MGTPGVPWIPKQPIDAVLRKHRGVLSHAAKELELDHHTLLHHIRKDPALVTLLAQLRNGFVQDGLDIAEGVLFKKMSNDTSSQQLQAAIYYLNNQGKSLGYAHPDAQQSVPEHVTQQAKELMDMLKQLQAKPEAQTEADHQTEQASATAPHIDQHAHTEPASLQAEGCHKRKSNF